MALKLLFHIKLLPHKTAVLCVLSGGCRRFKEDPEYSKFLVKPYKHRTNRYIVTYKTTF